jgi:anti-sigma B factor antagonist
MIKNYNSTDGVSVIELTVTSLDASNTDAFKDAVKPFVQGPNRIALDMALLDFMDSSGLGSLVWMLREIQKNNGDIRLAAVTRPVQTLLEMVKMHRIFKIHANVPEALNAYSPT